jgi:hypothetical protein
VELLRTEVIELTVRRPVTDTFDVAHLARKVVSAGTRDVEEELAEGVAGRVTADTAIG